jgi:hypothetical protein
VADATNEVRDLWLYDDGSWREGFRDDGKVSPLLHFIARPAADDEARERDRDEWRARAERAEAATREADARANTATVACDLMRARAEKAEAERDELRARLDAARGGAS